LVKEDIEVFTPATSGFLLSVSATAGNVVMQNLGNCIRKIIGYSIICFKNVHKSQTIPFEIGAWSRLLRLRVKGPGFMIDILRIS
jgi:hypothetical protein